MKQSTLSFVRSLVSSDVVRSPASSGIIRTGGASSPDRTPLGKKQKSLLDCVGSACDASDIEADEGRTDDADSYLATLKCLPLQPEDQPCAKWIIRVVNPAGKIGFLCRCCRLSQPPGIWTTAPCYPQKQRRQPIKRHGEQCRSHQHCFEAYFKDSVVMQSMIGQSQSMASINLGKQIRIAKFIAMHKLPLEMYPEMMTLHVKLDTFGLNETALYRGIDSGTEMIEAMASATTNNKVCCDTRSRCFN